MHPTGRKLSNESSNPSSTRRESKTLPQKVRLCLPALQISINEFSTFVASRGLDDDVVASITAEGGPRLQDILTQLRQLFEIAEECMWPLNIHGNFLLNELPVANVLHEMRSPMQTAGSCSTVTSHQHLDMSQTTQECRKPYQDSPFESRSIDLERDKSLETPPVPSIIRGLPRRQVNFFPYQRDSSLPPLGPIRLSDLPGPDITPLIAAPTNLAPDEKPPPHCPQPLNQFAHCKILIVEDHFMNQIVILKILRKLGLHNNVVAPRSQAAVDMVRESMDIYQPFDFIFIDEQMPFFTGDEATRLIRERGFRGPICAMLVNGTLAQKQKAFDAGVTTIMQKPF